MDIKYLSYSAYNYEFFSTGIQNNFFFMKNVNFFSLEVDFYVQYSEQGLFELLRIDF